MVKPVLCLSALAILSILSIFTPNKAFAQTVCQDISECTIGRRQIIKVYLYADDNPECIDNRQFYNCSGTTCFQDSTTCTEQQLICNNGVGNTPNDGYTCNKYCKVASVTYLSPLPQLSIIPVPAK